MDGFIERFQNYNKKHCYQYEMRLQNLKNDIQEIGIPISEIQKLGPKDFEIKMVTDKSEHREMIEFIKKNEWLGTISQFTTHWFGAYYNGMLGGVILFNVPNSFSKLLGENTKNLERLISRGACASWTPNGLASHLIMTSIKKLVEVTDYRLFTAYSDPTAKELGTIYQACNFYYLGSDFGGGKKYKNPYSGKYVSDRFFRQKTAYKKFAKELGIEWGLNWNHKTGMSWDNIPDDVEKQLRQYSKMKQLEAEAITVPKKMKYAYVLGRDKRETKKLRKLFLSKNKVYEYPKERG